MYELGNLATGMYEPSSTAWADKFPYVPSFIHASCLEISNKFTCTVTSVLCLVYVTLATKRFGRVKHWLVAGIMTFPHKEPVK